MAREYSINDETLNKLVNEVQNNHLFALVGENMSGKTELMRKLRESKKYIKENINFLTLHIELPLNQYLISHNNEPAGSIRSDEIIKILDKIQDINSITPENNTLNDILDKVNTSLKLFHGNLKVVTSKIQTQEEKSKRHLNKVIRIVLGIKEDDILNQKDLEVLQNSVIDLIKKSNLKNEGLNDDNLNQYQKVIEVAFDGRNQVRLTQASAGLGVLVTLVFVIETISYFNNINCLLLIDELEAYLHPDWQKKLLKYLEEKSNEKINVIFSTHSQHLILTNKLDAVGLVKYIDKEITFSKVFDNVSIINVKKDRELNILQPIEDALGIELSILSTPFLTVEGEEELMLFSYLFTKFKSQLPPKIINLHGKDNLSPYILLSKIYANKDKAMQGIFILDADIDFTKVGHIEKRKEAIINLQDRFIFIGKRLYDFQEVYPNNDLTKHKGECLEDFFAVNILGQNNSDGYEVIRQLTKNLVFNIIQEAESITNFSKHIDTLTIHKFAVMVSYIKENITESFTSSDPKIQNRDQLIQKIKESVLNKVLENDEKLEKIKCLIEKIDNKLNQL